MVKRRRRKSGVKERGSMLTHKFLGGPLLADVIYYINACKSMYYLRY